MKRHLLLLIAILVCAQPVVAQPAELREIDAYAARVMKEFEVPGLAIAVVKDGQVVLAKGYGVRRMGDATPVDANTLFQIASNTKAFTSAALAMLVDDGKIQWDDPVIKHMPAFQMYDPYVTREITIRDLLVHRSGLGLGAGDLMFWPQTTFTRDEIIHRLRFIKPATSFRSRYAYDNVLYLVAGQLVPAISGKSWEQFVRDRILATLGMTNTRMTRSEVKPTDNFATPHAPVDGRIQAVSPTSNLENLAPAGSINSSVNDMSKWLIARLDNEKSKLFSERSAREMWTPQTIMPIGDPISELAALRPNFQAYGLGWVLSDYRGKKVVSHTGGLLGMVSKVTLVPELKLGIVVLTNQEARGGYDALNYYVLDSYYGKSGTDLDRGFSRRGRAKSGSSRSGREVASLHARDGLEAVIATFEICRFVSRRVVRRCEHRARRRAARVAIQ